MNLKIRNETKKDFSTITNVNDLAFKQTNEGKLVESLRKSTSFVPELSLVALTDDKVVGHILFYPVKIKSAENEYETLSLAPMSVLPEYQHKGIGSKLVLAGLEKAKELGYKSVIVLGHPNYYPKFGFEPASRWKITAPFDAPDEAFIALELVEGELINKSGTVEYPHEFFEAL